MDNNYGCEAVNDSDDYAGLAEAAVASVAFVSSPCSVVTTNAETITSQELSSGHQQ